MATHSSVLAWEIPWTEEPNGLQSMGSQASDRMRSEVKVANLVENMLLEVCILERKTKHMQDYLSLPNAESMQL